MKSIVTCILSLVLALFMDHAGAASSKAKKGKSYGQSKSRSVKKAKKKPMKKTKKATEIKDDSDLDD
jgi:nitrate reductase cytochrome c-type subunit